MSRNGDPIVLPPLAARMLDAVGQSVIATLPDGRIVYWNRAAADLYGWAAEEVLGLAVRETILPSLTREQADAMLERARAGTVWTGELMVRRKDGVVFPTLLTQSPAFDEDGRLACLVGVGIDLTAADVTSMREAERSLREAVADRQRAEESLRRRNERLGLLSEAAGRLLSTADPDAVVPGLFEHIAGHLELDAYFSLGPDRRSGELVLETFAGISELDAELLRSGDRTRYVCERVARTRQVVVLERIRESDDPAAPLLRRLGLRAYACFPLFVGDALLGTLAFASRRRDEFGPAEVEFLATLARYVGIAKERLRLVGQVADHADRLAAMNRDLERRVAERTAVAEHRASQLQMLAAELTQAEQAERRRVATILHDHLQQLLVGAKLHAGIAGKNARAGGGLRSSLRQVEELLSQAVETSRNLSVELCPPILQDRGLRPALEWLARRFRDHNGLEVDLDLDGDAEPADEALRTVVFESVRELLLNVAKHAGVERARLVLRRDSPTQLSVEVSDDGHGFDMDEVRAAMSKVGLFRVRHRLELMGGSLEVRSAPGNGARVRVLAPLQLAEESLAPVAPLPVLQAVVHPPVPAHAPGGGDRVRVLLADDHRILRQGLIGLLRLEPDIEVIGEASDGQMALELARELSPDVIVMDVTMPRLSGIEATRRITSEMPAIRVIGLSMHEERDMADAMIEAGATAYLPKGGPSETLIATIRGTIPPSRTVPRAVQGALL